MTEPANMTMRTAGSMPFSVEGGVAIDLDEMSARRSKKDGVHFWAIAMMFYIADPEVAMDDMTLDETNILGPTDIHCLWCKKPYRTPVDPGSVCDG